MTEVTTSSRGMLLEPPGGTAALVGSCSPCGASVRIGVASLRLPDVLPEVTRPVHEVVEQLPDQVLGRGIRKVPLRIKALGRIADHHFGSVERMHV